MINSKSFEASADAQATSPPASQNCPKKPPDPCIVLSNQRQGSTGKISQRLQGVKLRNRLLLAGSVILLWMLRPTLMPAFDRYFQPPLGLYPPLAMAGGDPYVRALMRTISASESNDRQPYSLLYSGEYFSGWSHHPDRCIVIVSGPNQGNCSTAAGRYQFITTTWEEKAQRYGLNSEGWLLWQHYAFDPVSQDLVIHRWLSDPAAWDADIPALLRDGRLDEVLSKLSGTWTSLGYGIETNAMTPHLNKLYQSFLKEEQAKLSKLP
jgi:muramidase (phage lysozyme)